MRVDVQILTIKLQVGFCASCVLQYFLTLQPTFSLMSYVTLQPRFGNAWLLQCICDSLIKPSGEVATSTFVTLVSFRDSILRVSTPRRGSWGSNALFSCVSAIGTTQSVVRGWSLTMPLSPNRRTVVSLGLSLRAPGPRPPNPHFGPWLRSLTFLYTFSLATSSFRAPGAPGCLLYTSPSPRD